MDSVIVIVCNNYYIFVVRIVNIPLSALTES